ncbi:hypothetical protein S40293_10512 [Stachybotrys chartarum IBT 40293]|nr:hypothetical protein S40293_10512 [Stachybotrys chartarum IBT 40293]
MCQVGLSACVVPECHQIHLCELVRSRRVLRQTPGLDPTASIPVRSTLNLSPDPGCDGLRFSVVARKGRCIRHDLASGSTFARFGPTDRRPSTCFDDSCAYVSSDEEDDGRPAGYVPDKLYEETEGDEDNEDGNVPRGFAPTREPLISTPDTDDDEDSSSLYEEDVTLSEDDDEPNNGMPAAIPAAAITSPAFLRNVQLDAMGHYVPIVAPEAPPAFLRNVQLDASGHHSPASPGHIRDAATAWLEQTWNEHYSTRGQPSVGPAGVRHDSTELLETAAMAEFYRVLGEHLARNRN